MKSKNNPKGMKASAAHIGAYASGGPRQYRMELMMDMKPQKPDILRQPPVVDTQRAHQTIQFRDQIRQVQGPS